MTPRERLTCELCGTLLSRGTVCTNSRCGRCHQKYCTPGGNTSPGHGRGNPPVCSSCGYLLSVEPCTTQIVNGVPQQMHVSCLDRARGMERLLDKIGDDWDPPIGKEPT